MNKLLAIEAGLDGNLLAKIQLGKESEQFELNLTTWSQVDYINQWEHAVKFTLENGAVSVLIKNYESALNGVKKISIFTIIPEEVVDPKKYIFQNIESEFFYITESFIFITETLDLLDSNEPFEKIKEIYGDYFPIFHFDVKNLFRLYLYMSDNVEGRSNWKIDRNMLKTVLSH